mmetsp:Transcript_37921/g.59979  ORF Transcript_37921/g.59979 Transcript_37921/m.59979 type:complete len:514 (-) Transcript_37921:18-1559(-)|eukprot:CAMPEP_0201531546 /NCGR_PEP_ID=MMETSP0161_2-20130828/47944_1 /ASSEMBLY_ACC=CAM_ASM_000251 /TAXON_ID=180227 /ORGANISM="Neoparamoeba aestuarina, Strain SoJaBio B1-5/56/2" /LENGTH=513 /DNA_ID=CAMNT_0047934511 /DNA_START=139 /DNA_END=1680 /DNA_ORIENTATION=+
MKWLSLIVVVVVLMGGCEALWPLPSSMTTGDDSVCISTEQFKISSSCDFVQNSIDRYQNGLFFQVDAKNGIAYSVSVSVENCLDRIEFLVDESYELTLGKNGGKITANTSIGAVRALETLSQIFVYNSDGCYNIDGTDLTINDAPRFPWRGVMLDTARHYLSVDVIKQNLDAMSWAKFNVFHWHMIDAESFPIIIEAQPALAEKGAYVYPEATYTPEDVEAIQQYANARGIRLVAEIEMPGHAASYGKGRPDIVANCPKYEANINNIPLNPSIQETYEVVFAVLSQIAANVAFDDYIHIGGDEVVYGCWFNDSSIASWANEKGFDGNQILQYFEDNVAVFFKDLKRKRVVWEEVLLAGALNHEVESIVQVWKDSTTMQQVLDNGFQGLQSYGWYLAQQVPSIATPPVTHGEWLDTWMDMYSVEPTDGLTGNLDLVIGGEACMWGEQINDGVVMQRIWPRAGAVAERLWSAMDVTDQNEAQPRLEDFSCRMQRRGITSSPLRPSYCSATTYIQY